MDARKWIKILCSVNLYNEFLKMGLKHSALFNTNTVDVWKWLEMSASLHITEELEYGLKLQLRTHTSVLYLWTDIDSVTTTTINWKELYILEETILSHVLVKHIFCIYNQTYIICYVSSTSAFMLRHTVKILQHPYPCTYPQSWSPT